MNQGRVRGKAVLGLVVLGACLWLAVKGLAQPSKDRPDVEFTVVNMEYEGNNIWLPSPLVVKKGSRVRINLINNVKKDPNVHGFAVEAFAVLTTVNRGKPTTVEFKADKEGIFRIHCQLHPKHVGGQILVLK